MQRLVQWLVSRPLHGILALAATISLAWFSFLSGAVLVLLILHKGIREALFDVAGAAVLMVVVGVIAQLPLTTVLTGAFAIWLPALLLGLLLVKTRSLTLTLQVSVLVAVAGLIGFFVIADDPIAFWHAVLGNVIETWRGMGLNEQAALLEAERDTIAAQMTMVAVITSWTVHVAACALGYKLFRQLPGEIAPYGRFRDLNFGRVIAFIMAVTSMAALVSGAVWMQNLAFVMFAIFWLQGLAIVHWLHGASLLPTFGLVAVYVLMPFLNVILLMGLALTGYIDAWFGFRRTRAASR